MAVFLFTELLYHFNACLYTTGFTKTIKVINYPTFQLHLNGET